MKKLKLEELGRLTPGEYRDSEKLPVIVVLDNIRSGMNVGSFFRTCDALGLQEIILTGICPQPPHKEVNKTAIGADNTVDWSYHESTLDAINVLKSKGFQIISVEQVTNSIPLTKVKENLSERVAIVFGNEVEGVAEEVINASDLCVEIEQFGTKHSFNVAVCGGIVLYTLSTTFRN